MTKFRHRFKGQSAGRRTARGKRLNYGYIFIYDISVDCSNVAVQRKMLY